jgi:hypothetical protein
LFSDFLVLKSFRCIQSLKCHANTCPTGIATQDEALIAGLDVSDKRVRAFNFHAKTVEAAADIIASCGFSALDQLRTRPVIMTRINAHNVRPLRDLYPPLKAGELLNNDWVAPTTEPTIRDRIFNVWNISTAKAAQAVQ